MKNIVALSGGIASAWVADWVLKHVDKDAILYFNDTKWEDKDLYRFLDELSEYWDRDIHYDTDGRTPEDVFYDQKMLANNRVPLCSRILKADRLQKYIEPGDVVFFGIDMQEAHRCKRISDIYEPLGVHARFPMVEEAIFKPAVFQWLTETGIEMPRMYKLGFSHNNCSGGVCALRQKTVGAFTQNAAGCIRRAGTSGRGFYVDDRQARHIHERLEPERAKGST